MYNIVKNKFIWKGKLDLVNGEFREDPKKLLLFSYNCLNLFARSDNSKGVTMYSCFDGTIVAHKGQMHTNYIY